VEREQFWINFFRSYIPENGYNISPTASSCAGLKQRPEVVRQRMKRQSKPWSSERKARWKETRKGFTWKGNQWTEGQKQMLSLAHLGIKWTPTQRENWMAAMKKVKNPFNKKAVL